ALPGLHHRLTEFFGRYLDRAYATVLAALALALPFVMGLGAVLPTLFLLALLKPALPAPARRIWLPLFLGSLALPWLVREADSLLLPRVSQSWIGVVSRAQHSRWTPALAASLDRAQAEAPGRFEIPFARGLVLLRAGRAAEARTQ